MIKISILSPQQIWNVDKDRNPIGLSHGEVKLPDLLNRKLTPALPLPDGLLCQRIFGPVEDYVCACKQLSGRRNFGKVCEKCGVTILSSKVRFERFGHIELPLPILHPLALSSIQYLFRPLKMAALQDISKVLLFEEGKKGKFILKDGRRGNFSISTDFASGEPISIVLTLIDYEASALVNKRVKAIREREIKPENYVITRLPVIPAGYRPEIPMGQFWITSNLNTHYAHILQYSARLITFLGNAPKIIINNELSLLQKAINSLYLPSKLRDSQGKPLKSLLEGISGKEGRIRANLLGKRVDFSGRTVITVGPELPVDTIKLPIKMAFELFKPFIIHHLLKTNNHRGAIKEFNARSEQTREILFKVAQGYKIFINRQPTLHRLGFQAFKIILHEGHNIVMPPQVMGGFNADCVTGDTEVHTLKEGSVRIDELVKRCKEKPGYEFYVWSRDKDGKQIPGLAHSARKIKDTNKLVHITLDNGKIFKCTLNHELLLRNNTYKKAKDIKTGTSLMPFYFKESHKYGYGYIKPENCIYDEEQNKYVPEYWLSYERFSKTKRGIKSIHHLDHDHRNNEPTNLKAMEANEHKWLHSLLFSENYNKSQAHKDKISTMNSDTKMKKLQQLGRYSKMYCRIVCNSLDFNKINFLKVFPHSNWKIASSFSITEYEKYVVSTNYKAQCFNWIREEKITPNTFISPRSGLPFYKPWKRKDKFIKVLEKLQSKNLEVNKQNFNRERSGITYIDWYTWFSLFNYSQKELNLFISRRNHKVKEVKVETLTTPMPMYDLTVEEHHNVAYSNGLYTHQCDGDQVAVHLPISQEALAETDKMTPANNVLSPASGEVAIKPSHEILIGAYFMTNIIPSNNLQTIASIAEGDYRVNVGDLKINEQVIFKKKKTCVGRLILGEILDCEITEFLTKKNTPIYIKKFVENWGRQNTLDALKEFQDHTLRWVTHYGISIGMDDFVEPKNKNKYFTETLQKIKEENLNKEEQLRLWFTIITKLQKEMLEEAGDTNPLTVMLRTGARASMTQVSQLSLAKGLLANSRGEICLPPIKESLKNGLSVEAYFRSTSGSRKSLMDKLNATPLSGYLARKLVSASRNFYIREKDCGTSNGIQIRKSNAFGRYTTTGEFISKKETSNIFSTVRSPITCETKSNYGICQKCYGIDPSTQQIIAIGSPIGVIAAQSLSEGSTQLTMRTFHFSGAASIRSTPLTVDSNITGQITNIEEFEEFKQITVQGSDKVVKFYLNLDAKVTIKRNETVEKGAVLASYESDLGQEDIIGTLSNLNHYYECGSKQTEALIATSSGTLTIEPAEKTKKLPDTRFIIFVGGEEQGTVNLHFPLYFGDGDYVEEGESLTFGEVHIRSLYKRSNLELTAKVVVDRIINLYQDEGIKISSTHIETIIRSMTNYVKLKGEYFLRTNELVSGKSPEVLSITNTSLNSPSWFDALAFGWSKRLIQTVFEKPMATLDTPTERIALGKRIDLSTGEYND